MAMASLLWLPVVGWLVSPIISFFVNKLLSELGFHLSRNLQELELQIIPSLEQILGDLTEQRMLRGAKNEGRGSESHLQALAKDVQSALYDADDVLNHIEYHRVEKKVIGDGKSLGTAIGDHISRCKQSWFGQKLWQCTQNSLVQMIYDWLVYGFSALRSFYLAARLLRDWSYELVGIKNDDDTATDYVLSINERITLRKRIKDIEYTVSESKKSPMLNQNSSSGPPKGADKESSSSTSQNSAKQIDDSDRIIEEKVFGRDKDREHISRMLREGADTYAASSSTSTPYSVIGIHGITGSGKSTLAQYVCDYEKAARHFDLIMFIYVGEVFSLSDIFCDMLEQIKHSRSSIDKDLKSVKTQLWENLKNKRFLLVLDDLWVHDGKQKEQHILLDMLSAARSGSRILVTAKKKDAAEALGAQVQIPIRKLKEWEYLSLFMHHARPDASDDDGEYERIGRKIANRLHRSPIAAVTVGKQLQRNKSISFWKTTAKLDVLGKTMGALWWSYQQLGVDIRRCFGYCSILPDGFEIYRDELVHMWIAQGFVKTRSNATEELEDVGQGYFNELLILSFLQVHRTNLGAQVVTINVLLHKLVKRVAGGEFFRIVSNNGPPKDIPPGVRHLYVGTIGSDNRADITKKLLDLKSLRTLIIIEEDSENNKRFLAAQEAKEMLHHPLINEEVFEKMFKRLTKLRVLIVRTEHYHKPVFSVPASIDRMKNLCYLAFRFYQCSHRVELVNSKKISATHKKDVELIFPGTFSKLYHLQGLHASKKHIFNCAENMAKNLICLRYCSPRLDFPNIGKLISLQTLAHFQVKEEQGYELEQLKHLNKLRGTLKIAGLGIVGSKKEALEAQLVDKERLRRLKLSFGRDKRDPDVEAEVIEGLCPPKYLQELEIRWYRGSRYPSWMLSRHHSETTPKHLHKLDLWCCSQLASIPEDSELFIGLCELSISWCDWDRLPQNMERLVSLQTLAIFHCNRMDLLPNLPHQSLKTIIIVACHVLSRTCQVAGHKNWHKIQHIPQKLISPRRDEHTEACNSSDPMDVDSSLPSKVSQQSSKAKAAWRDSPQGRLGLRQPGAEHEKKALSSQSSKEMDGDVWLLDCREVMHHTSNAWLLDNIVGPLPSSLDDDDDNRIAGRVLGSVWTEQFQVLEVSYVEGDPSRNVISVAQLARSHGLVTVFEPTCAFVRDPANKEEEVGRASLRDGVYVLDYLRIDQPLVDAIIDASVHPDTRRTDELQSGSVVCEVERESWFGMSRSDMATDPTVDVFLMLSPYEQRQHGNRPKEFYMDSGVCHHLTWNGDVVKAYHEALQVKPPIESVNIMSTSTSGISDSLRVGGIGYIASKGGSLDRVLFVPDSPANLVSVSQITKDCSVRVVFHQDKFWIEKLETKERIGHGQQVEMNYVVAGLDVGAGSIWILDTIASHHHTSNRKMLYDYQEIAEDLETAGAGQLQIHGHGLVMNERFKVPGVHLIAGGTKNVVSVAQLVDDGLITVFQPKNCYVKHHETEKIVGKGRLLKNKYVLDYLRIDLQNKKTEELEDQEDNGSRHGESGSVEQEEKDEEGGAGGDRGKGGSGHGQSGGIGCAEGGEKEKSEGHQEAGDSGENKDEDKNSGGEGDGGGKKDNNNIDGNGKQKNKNDDIFGLARFGRIPSTGGRDSCRSYHRNNEDYCARVAPTMLSSNDRRERDRHFVMDSGACFHMTWDSTIIDRYSDSLGIILPAKSVIGVSGSNITVEYSGYICNDKTMLDGVLFVPESSMNLVSITELLDQYNLEVSIGKSGFFVYRMDGNVRLTIGKGIRVGQLFLLDYFRPGYLYVDNPDKWHYRRQLNSFNTNPDRTLTDGMIVKIHPSVTFQVAGEGNIQNYRIQLENGVYVGELKKELHRQVLNQLVVEERIILRNLENAGALNPWVRHFARPLQHMGVLGLLVEELDLQLMAVEPAFARLGQGNVVQEPQIEQLATHIQAMRMPLPKDWITLVAGQFEHLNNRMGANDPRMHLWEQMTNDGWLLLRSGTLSTHLQQMGMPNDTAQVLVSALRDPHINAASSFTCQLQHLRVPQPLIDELARQLTAGPHDKTVESWIEDIVGKIAFEVPLLPGNNFQITLGKSVVVANGGMDLHGVYYVHQLRPCPRVRLSLLSNSYQWALREVRQ